MPIIVENAACPECGSTNNNYVGDEIVDCLNCGKPYHEDDGYLAFKKLLGTM